MSYPKNPKNIILKNKFYPYGLTELDIWNHYQKYKNYILEQVKNRNAMLFIKIDDSIIVKRKENLINFIKLNQSNYNEIITGRTLSIHGIMNKVENIAIIDVDTDDFNKAIEATKDCYNILKRFPIFINLQIRFTGKTSFHIFCTLSKKMNIDSIRFLLNKIFMNSTISNIYDIKKSRSSKVNIDLYRNTQNSGFILLNSLSTIGLQCTEVQYNDLNNFMKEKSIMK